MRTLCAAALAALACAPAANAYVTDQQADLAAATAVGWIATQQTAETGQVAGFGGDWAMVALAGADVNAADLRGGPTAPSLQDYFHGSWVGGALGTLATDQARGILTGGAGGIQPSRVAAERNLVAALAAHHDGEQLGNAALINDDIFGALALDHAGAAAAFAPTLAAPIRAAQARPAEGVAGWGYATATANPDVDMTGAGIAALCAAGVPADDPDVAEAVEWLRTKQDPVSGGIVSSFFGPNSDSTGWVVNGLRQCGIDPQGPEWTAPGADPDDPSDDRTPLDFLLALQQPSGAFAWQEGSDAENLYSTQGAVTALVGDGFGHPPAARVDPGDPTLRPAPDVPAGSPVPLTVAIDHGPDQPGAERICATTAPLGATVAEVLGATAESAVPGGCVTGLELSAGAAPRLLAVNGVSAQEGASRWLAAVDGGEPQPALDATAGLGAVVSLTLAGPAPTEPPAPLPPVDPPAAGAPLPGAPAGPGRPSLRPARAILRRGGRLRLRRGAVRVAVRCPRGTGADGCRGALRIRFRRGGRWVTAGRAAFEIGAGSRRRVVVRVGPRLRRLTRVSQRPVAVRLVAAVRDLGSGIVRTTGARARLRR
ncbi:MAG: hypothetical protein GXY03_09765 [Solirubrobacterales bacterium]|nr:hypothetical protein [Solirubrobacterales bacterium]